MDTSERQDPLVHSSLPPDNGMFDSENHHRKPLEQRYLLSHEEMERLEDEAVKTIQHAYKAYRVRAQFRFLLRQSFMKIFDKDFGAYVYVSKMTGSRFQFKPSFLGEEDIPVHRVFTAPPDYVPRTRRGGEGFAMMITVTQFQHAKIPPLADCLLEDHRALADALTHDFYGRISPQNLLSLVNPRRSEMLHAFELMARMTRNKADTFLVIYFCTHVVKVIGGDSDKREGPREKDCFFLLHDSVWRSPAATAASALSLVDLSELMNECKVDHKTILLNFAHLPHPRKTLLGSGKAFYPPQDCLNRLCEMAKAAVVGSCCIGTSLTDSLRCSTPLVMIPYSAIDPLQYLNGIDQKTSSEVMPNRGVYDEASNEYMASYLREVWGIDESAEISHGSSSVTPQVTWKKDSSSGEILVRLPRPEEVR